MSAHASPYSYLDLLITGDVVEGTLVVHMFDAAHDLGVSPPERLLEQTFLSRKADALIALLAPRLDLRAEGLRLSPTWGTVEPLPPQQAIRLTFRVAAPFNARLAFHPVLFPYDPRHQTFVNVFDRGVLRQQSTITAASGGASYDARLAESRLAIVRTFVASGIRHIMTGPDHILFLVGLLLLGGRWARLALIVTAFTLGHALTLSLASLDVVSLPRSIAESAMALSIVWVGADNLFRAGRRDVRVRIALAFGLVHGLGSASLLREVGLSRPALAWSLLSFNTGVEIGQLVIVLIATSALGALRDWNRDASRRVVAAGSVAVMLVGAYWFVERAFFTL